MSEQFIGEIRWFAFDYAPKTWATCSGQILLISTNSALFALLGVTYGGNGSTTFALPDLRGRAGIHRGQGPGLAWHPQGEAGGVESVTLAASQMPTHAHLVPTAGTATTGDPTGALPATAPVAIYGADVAVDTKSKARGTMAGPTTPAGGGQPHENRPPSLVVNPCIALNGVFPTRN